MKLVVTREYLDQLAQDYLDALVATLSRTIAALYVEPRGAYSGLPGVELWDEARDARNYAGPHPVVAHPPCARWCRLAGFVEARWGHKRGEDGGCFKAALEAVRRWGGVLEHPAYSDAWRAFGLNRPPRAGGWVSAGDGGWTCHVEQGWYGHAARKATWLYAHGVELLDLKWGRVPGDARVRRRGVGPVGDARKGRSVELQSRAERIKTPPEFRDMLVGLARSVPPGRC